MSTKVRIMLLVAIGVLIAGMVMLTRLQKDDSPAAAKPSSTASSAVDVLRAGMAYQEKISYHSELIVNGQAAITIDVDSPGRRALGALAANGETVDIRIVDRDVYLRATPGTNLPGAGPKWLHLDPARVPVSFGLTFESGIADAGGLRRVIAAINTARRTPSGVDGTLDLTKIGTGNGISIQPEQAAAAGEAGKAVPYEAKLDAQGRIVSFMIAMNSTGSATMGMQYSAFGATVVAERPAAAEMMDAPDALYARLGSVS